MLRSIQTFSVNGKFTERYHIYCARIDLLFTIFVCSRYRPWATIRLLHHFGFVMCVNSGLYCTHFSCHWRKIRNVSRRLTQISKRQRDPWFLFCHNWSDICCNSISGTAPQYLSDLLQTYTPARQLRSASDTQTFVTPRVNTKTFGERSFSYAGPSVWNNLPQTLRHSDSTSSFKAALKTHLFNNYF